MDDKSFEMDLATYERIAALIQSDSSPVGIDAKKTHVLILNKLSEISDRLKLVEQKLGPQ